MENKNNMKIKVKEMVTFLRKIQTSELINSCILRFEKDSIKIDAKEPSGIIALYGVMKTSIFKNYNPIGSIGIGNIDNFILKLESFKVDELEMIYNDDKRFEIRWDSKGIGAGSTILKDIKSLDEVSLDKIRNIEFDKTIKVPSNSISALEKQFDGNDTEICKFIINKYGNSNGVGVLSFVIHFGRDLDKDTSFSQEYFYKILTTLDESYKDYEKYNYTVGRMIINIMKAISGDVVFNICKDEKFPLVLSTTNDEMNFHYVIGKTQE